MELQSALFMLLAVLAVLVLVHYCDYLLGAHANLLCMLACAHCPPELCMSSAAAAPQQH